MTIFLGNMSVKQIEERTQVEFSEEIRQFLNDSRQENVSIPLGENKWHCFDIPFFIQCGSDDFLRKVYERLKPYGDQMEARLQLGR